MDNKEQAFAQLVREHKSTIYSVCYMFPEDSDEIDDRALQTKRLLKSCEDIILRLQMKEDDPQNN